MMGFRSLTLVWFIAVAASGSREHTARSRQQVLAPQDLGTPVTTPDTKTVVLNSPVLVVIGQTNGEGCRARVDEQPAASHHSPVQQSERTTASTLQWARTTLDWLLVTATRPAISTARAYSNYTPC